MKMMSSKEFCRLLGHHGKELKRVHGSHHIYMKPGRIERISVPVHANKTLKIGLLKALLKLADINL